MGPKQNKTILVVEDEVPLQDAVKLKLDSAGYTVWQAFTAEQALDILDKGQMPDFVWLDLLLPGMGGFQFLERVRANAKLQKLPVMVVSVSAGPEKIQRAFQLNVVDYVVKSQYQLKDIISKVHSFLNTQPFSHK